MDQYLFNAEEKYAKKSSNESFILHSHNEYEIYLFLEGDSKNVTFNFTKLKKSKLEDALILSRIQLFY